MHLLRAALATCLVLSLLVQVIDTAPVQSAAITASDASDPTHMINLVGEMAQRGLSRQRRSFAQLHQGRRHYFNSRRASRRFGRRFESRRRYRLHHQGAGQTVYE